MRKHRGEAGFDVGSGNRGVLHRSFPSALQVSLSTQRIVTVKPTHDYHDNPGTLPLQLMLF